MVERALPCYWLEQGDDFGHAGGFLGAFGFVDEFYSGTKSGTHLIGCLECSPGPDARSDREGTWESDARQAVVDTRVGVSTVSTCVENRVASDNVR